MRVLLPSIGTPSGPLPSVTDARLGFLRGRIPGLSNWQAAGLGVGMRCEDWVHERPSVSLATACTR